MSPHPVRQQHQYHQYHQRFYNWCKFSGSVLDLQNQKLWAGITDLPSDSDTHSCMKSKTLGTQTIFSHFWPQSCLPAPLTSSTSSFNSQHSSKTFLLWAYFYLLFFFFSVSVIFLKVPSLLVNLSQGDQTSQSWRKSTLNIHWKDWWWSWSSNVLATWC